MNSEGEISRLREVRPGMLEPILDTPADTYLKLVIDTTRLRKRAFKSIDDLLHQKEKRFAFADSAPFAIASKSDPTKVIMYPNIPRSIDPETLATHALDLWSDGRKRKKIEDFDRAANFAKKREVTTLGKFLTKHSNLKDIGYKDDKIRSFCENIAIENQPPRIVTCECPEDYSTMFKVKTGSCMEVGCNYWQEWSRKSLLSIVDDTGIYMSALYHYMPWCKGAYILVAGVPVARFMLYRTDLTKDQYTSYGDVRGSSLNYTKVMNEWLEKEGIKRSERMASTVESFRVPGFKHKILEDTYGAGQSFCPMPNMDNQRKDFKVAYDKDTDEFLVSPESSGAKGQRITDTYAWKGFIPSSKVPAV